LKIIQWFMLHGSEHGLMQNSMAIACPQKRNGKKQPLEQTCLPIHGGMKSTVITLITWKATNFCAKYLATLSVPRL